MGVSQMLTDGRSGQCASHWMRHVPSELVLEHNARRVLFETGFTELTCRRFSNTRGKYSGTRLS